MLSKKTKYGLKALSHLAAHWEKKPVLISQVAEAENIPKKFLEAILLQLKNSGVVGSKMGKGGGYYLLRSPEKTTVAQIYRLLEGPIAMVPCASLNYYEQCDDCQSEASCKISAIMIEVRDKTLSIYEHRTLKDLVKP
ncbi:MAG: Rrf2 family transcriptional regulator [Flavobacteriaceae bacterium]|nr:Rrf2 family transcriptional regulator [Flavobacteriaceae bacterium]